jgi:hypothetical protein
VCPCGLMIGSDLTLWYSVRAIARTDGSAGNSRSSSSSSLRNLVYQLNSVPSSSRFTGR